MQKKGFTLIELLVVIVILAILATVAVPSYNRYTDRSQRQAAQQYMLDVLNRAEEFRLDRRAYPANLAAMDIDADDVPDHVRQHFTITVVGNNGATPPTFTVTAVPLNTARHQTMTLNQNLVKTPTEHW